MPPALDWHTATNFAALKEALGATRVMHVAERGGWNAREARTDEMEVWLGAPEDELPASARSWAAGDGPWVLGGEDEGLVVHHVPGHSLGSVVLHMDDKVLFTGDHLAFSHRAKLLGFGSKHTRDYPRRSRACGPSAACLSSGCCQVTEGRTECRRRPRKTRGWQSRAPPTTWRPASSTCKRPSAAEWRRWLRRAMREARADFEVPARPLA